MWLRDYLPGDIRNQARILLYGYESQLQGVNSNNCILRDFGATFIEHLMSLRDHPSVSELNTMVGLFPRC